MAIIPIQFKDKKEQSFTKLIEENKLKFYKTAKIILKNDDDCYDALQEALISIYKNYEQLNNKEYFSTWATRIVINKCYDLLRKNKKNIISFDDNYESEIQSSKYDEYDIDQYGIKKAIGCLNDDLKLIIILYYYDDFSIKEISKIVEIPEGTVKSRLSNARNILKKELKKEEI